MNLSKIKEFVKRHKILFITGICGSFLLILVVALLLFNNPLKGKKNIGVLYYDQIEGVKDTATDNGAVGDKVNWDSIKYTLDGMIIDIVHYRNRDISNDIGVDEDYKDVTVNGVKYRYLETKIAGDYCVRQYYTQVGDQDTYYISATFRYSQENIKKIEKLLNSVIFNQK